MKAQYGILRFKKYKGPAISPIEAHNERTKEQYASNPDIDTDRSRYNLHLVQPQGRYREEADRMIAAAHCRVRKDSVRVVEALVTASPEFFKDKNNREIRAYFAYALKFLEGRQRPDTFLSAVVHMDEKTPHLHLCFVPLTADGRLSAKEIIGNRKNLVKWQDEFWQHMVKQYPELERGESASQTGREHIPPRIFKEMTQLTKQKEQLDALLVGITPFNGKSRAAEISKVLDSYIPNVARMKDQLRKYNVAFTKTAAENEKLKEKNKTLSASLDKAKEGSVLKRLEDAKLRQDYEAALKTLDSIPPEVIRFYENRTQEHPAVAVPLRVKGFFPFQPFQPLFQLLPQGGGHKDGAAGGFGLGVFQDEGGLAALQLVREDAEDTALIHLRQRVLLHPLHGTVDGEGAHAVGSIKVDVLRGQTCHLPFPQRTH
jgi:hypothetical protein